MPLEEEAERARRPAARRDDRRRSSAGRSRPASPAACTPASTAARAGRRLEWALVEEQYGRTHQRDPLARAERLQRLGARQRRADRPLPAPGAARRAQGRLRGHRARRRLGPLADRGDRASATDAGFRINGEKWFVTARRRRRGLRRDGERDRRRRPAADPVRRRPRPRRASRSSTTRPSPTTIPTATRRSASRDVEVGRGRRDRRRSAAATTSSAPGSPRSGSGSPPAAAARCGGCSTRPSPGPPRASRAARGSSTTRASPSRSPTRPPTRRPGACSRCTVAALADAGADPKLVHHKASMAKLFISEAAWRCADRCVQAFGGRGYLRSNVAERLLRELRVDRIWEGTSEIQRLIVARGLERRGRRADPPLARARRLAARRLDLTPAARAPLDRRRRGDRPRPAPTATPSCATSSGPGSTGAVWGVNPKRDAVHGRACVPSRRRPARAGRRGRRRDPGRRGRRAVIAEAAARGCGGAVVFSAGFGEVEAGRELERELREVARRGRAARSAARTATASSRSAPRAPMWGDSVPDARARAAWR